MVRVIVERRCRPAKVGDVANHLIELRARATRQRGYVSGETLRSLDNPSHWLVVSTWVDADLWKVWETSPERREVEEKIKALLVTPEKVSVFEFAHRGGAASAYTIDK